MLKLKNIILGLIVGAFAFTCPVMAAEYKCPTGTIREDSTVVNPTLCNIDEKEDNDLIETVMTIIKVALSILGVVTVIMIIFGGVQYVTSAGDPGKVTKAKSTILYGIIGLIISLLAFAIVNFVLSSVFENDNSNNRSTKTVKTERESKKSGVKMESK